FAPSLGMGALIRLQQWPRSATDNRPVLMHIAALAYHYNAATALNRQSELYLAELAGSANRDTATLSLFLEGVLRKLWVPQTVAFIAQQLSRKLHTAGPANSS